MSRRRLTGLSIVCVICLLGCESTPPDPPASEPPPALELEWVKFRVADLPEERVAVQYIREGFYYIEGQGTSYESLRRRFGEGEGEVVYCEVEKFAPIPREELEGLATVVVRSGGRFFYRQILGAIDSLFSCVEIREVGSAGR